MCADLGMSQIGRLVALPFTGGAPDRTDKREEVPVEMGIAGATVLVVLYTSHCLRAWLRGRARPSTASAHTASATPDMVRMLPAGSRLTVRAADGALVQVELAGLPGSRRD